MFAVQARELGAREHEGSDTRVIRHDRRNPQRRTLLKEGAGDGRVILLQVRHADVVERGAALLRHADEVALARRGQEFRFRDRAGEITAKRFRPRSPARRRGLLTAGFICA